MIIKDIIWLEEFEEKIVWKHQVQPAEAEQAAHRGKAMGEVGFERIFLLPYSPELNPCERVFEWLRAKIEGEVYKSLQHKRCVIEQHLRRLSRDKSSLEQLVSWQWIRAAFAQLCV